MALLDRIGAEGRVIGIDKDPLAVAAGQAIAAREPRLAVHQGAFSNLRRLAESEGVCGRVNGVLLDLGVSSPQLDDPARGFSFLRDGPLDMRMDPHAGPSAAQWLNSAREGEIARVLKDYGEERYSRRIAAAVVRARTHQPLATTAELASLVAAASPTRERDKHPATRTFQAVRIFINRELEELDAVLDQVLDVLAPGGRLAVISFHSLEDRRVKRFIRDQARGDDFPPELPVPHTALRPRLRPLGKPVRPSAADVEDNPRARSAVLRAAQRL